jgi:hypothetical protein
MAVMSQTPTPGERRLARPPSERYADEAASGPAGAPPTPGPGTTGSTGRAVAGALGIAVGAIVLTVLLGGVMALSAGLLVLWGAGGYLIGQAVRVGGADALERTGRTAIAVGVALGGVLVAQLGLWWYAGLEGGVLPLIDYLAQTFGVLVPLQAALAAALAWWASR